MSLSPVIGTEVPETANGVVTPISSENGPHIPVSVKYGGSRVPCHRETSEERALGYTENHVDVENRVYDGEGRFDTETCNSGRPSSLSLHTSHVTDPSLPAATCTGDSEHTESGSRDTDIHEASNTVEPPGAALLWDPAQQAHSKESSQRGGPTITDRQQTDTETADGDTDSRDEEEDGEKEKQDEEDDEKNEKKWIKQRAGGRTEVSGL